MAILGPDPFTVGSDTNLDAYAGAPLTFSYMAGSGAGAYVNATNDRVQGNGSISTAYTLRATNADAPTANQEIRAGVTLCGNASSSVWLNLRCAAGTHDCYEVEQDTANVRLARIDAGSGTILATAARGLSDGTAYASRGRATGTGSSVWIVAQIGDTAPAQFEDTNANRKTSGTPGVGLFYNAVDNSWLDNVEIDNLAATGIMTEVRHLQVGTGAANTHYVVGGLAFQPKAMLVATCGRSSEVDAAGEGDVFMSLGLGTSTSNRYAVGCEFDHGNTAIASDRIHRNDAILATTTVAGGIDGLLDISAINADNVDFIVDDAFAQAVTMLCVFLGGADLTDAKVIQGQEHTSASTLAYTGAGFKPNCAIFISCGNNTVPNNVTTEAHLMLGAATSAASANQWVTLLGSDDASGTSDTASYALDGECVAFMTNAGIPVTTNGRAALSSFDADGFTLNWLERTQTRYFFALCLQGGTYLASSVLSLGSIAQIAAANIGQSPRGVLFASCAQAKHAADTPAAHATLSVGAWGGTTNAQQMAIVGQDKDAAGTQDSFTAVEYDSVYINPSTATTQAIEGLIAWVSKDPTGFTLNQSDADPSANMFVPYLAFGDAPVPLERRVTPSGGLRKRAVFAA